MAKKKRIWSKTWSEKLIDLLLNRNNCNNGEFWKYVEMKNPDGSSREQSIHYPYPDGWASYPDFEKYNSSNIKIMLVEVKGYTDFFAKRKNTLAMLNRQYKSYFKVQKNEGVEIRIVFVIRNWGQTEYQYQYYWEKLNIIKKMRSYIEDYTIEYEDESVTDDFIFWDCSYFRTDIENLGEVFA